MKAASGIAVRVRLAIAGVAILLVASGCPQEEAAQTSPPKSPLPTAESGRPVQPKPSPADQGGETKKIGSVDRDLNKDLAASPIEPGGPTSYNPGAGKPEPSKPADASKSGKP